MVQVAYENGRIVKVMFERLVSAGQWTEVGKCEKAQSK